PEPAGALTSSTRPLPQPPFSASTAASTASNSNGLAIGVNEGSGALGNPDRPGWCEVLTAPCLFGAFVPSRLSCHDAKKLDPPQHALRRPNLPDRCVFPVRARCSCYSNFTATVRQRPCHRFLFGQKNCRTCCRRSRCARRMLLRCPCCLAVSLSTLSRSSKALSRGSRRRCRPVGGVVSSAVPALLLFAPEPVERGQVRDEVPTFVPSGGSSRRRTRGRRRGRAVHRHRGHRGR